MTGRKDKARARAAAEAAPAGAHAVAAQQSGSPDPEAPPTRYLPVEPLTAAAFAPFGRVLCADPGAARLINGGATTRFHGLASADPGPGGRAILSIFRGTPFVQPEPGVIEIAMLERHPLGAQAFMPLSGGDDWLAVVAERPDAAALRCFRARADQGVQYAAGVWHHPLLVLSTHQDFLVVDRDGPADAPGANLEEARFEPARITLVAAPGRAGA